MVLIFNSKRAVYFRRTYSSLLLKSEIQYYKSNQAQIPQSNSAFQIHQKISYLLFIYFVLMRLIGSRPLDSSRKTYQYEMNGELIELFRILSFISLY